MKTLKENLIILLLLTVICFGAVYSNQIIDFFEGLGIGLKNISLIWTLEPTEKKLAESVSEKSGEEGADLVKEDNEATNNNRSLADTFILLKNQRVTAYTIRPEEGTNCESASGVDLCKLGRDEPIFAVVNKELKLAEIMACPPEYDFETVISFLEVNYRGEIYERYFRCLDRMNAHHREQGDWDIFYGKGEEAYQRAMEWGIREVQIKVYNQ